jgi:hypothetical protein
VSDGTVEMTEKNAKANGRRQETWPPGPAVVVSAGHAMPALADSLLSLSRGVRTGSGDVRGQEREGSVEWAVPREPSLPPRYYENVREEHASTAGKAARSKRTTRRVVAPPPGLASRCCLLPGRWSWPLRFTPYLLCSCESFDPPMDKSSVSCYIYSIEKHIYTM